MLGFGKGKTITGTLCGLSRSSMEKAKKHALELKHPIGVVVYYNKKKQQFHTADGRKFTYAVQVPKHILKEAMGNVGKVESMQHLKTKYSTERRV